MNQARSIRHSLALAVIMSTATAPLAAQNPTPTAPPPARPAPIPASGSMRPDPAMEARLRRQVTVPEGFELTLFAGPPVALYPTCITDAPDGAIFVCADPNSSLSQLRRVGRVMRVVDEDQDGRADRYTTFLDVESPRGIAVDGETVYVMHPPTLAAYRDTNGDGIADWSRELVTGLGFGLEFRGADHTTNQIEIGPDGWIYVAVGDYGFERAIGADGTEISHRGGGVVRVRPDGTNLEIFATGTRNIYDLGISPFLEIFTRDNTNDGEGWDTRLHYLPPGSFMGYPTHYQNFPTEHFPSVADYGGGSGVGGLWLQDPAWPAAFHNRLLTADWTTNRVYTHALTPRGSTFQATQDTIIRMLRPTDILLDGRSSLYVSSLSGGQYTYVADTVGYVFRVRPPGVTTTIPAVAAMPDDQLVNLLSTEQIRHRTYVQRELVRRGEREGTARSLERLMDDRGQPAFARVAAMLTYKEILGSRSHPALIRLASAPESQIRAIALRALADRKDQLEGVPTNLFVSALADPDARVIVEAVNGLVRLSAVDAAESIMPLTASPDQGLAHLAVNAVARLGGRDAALRTLDGGTPGAQAGAILALGKMHDKVVVSALLDRLSRSSEARVRQLILSGLARLHFREAVFVGDWWTTKPSHIGPYYMPVAWEESPRIGTALRRALMDARGEDFTAVTNILIRNRVLPQGVETLASAAGNLADPRGRQTLGALVGLAALNDAAIDQISELNQTDPSLRPAIVQLLLAQPRQFVGSIDLLGPAALDAAQPPPNRERLLNAIASAPGLEATRAAISIFARLNPVGAGDGSPVDAGWRRWVNNARRVEELDYFVELTRSAAREERVLAYAVLLRTLDRNAASSGSTINPVIQAALRSPVTARELSEAVTILGLENQYGARLRAAGVQ